MLLVFNSSNYNSYPGKGAFFDLIEWLKIVFLGLYFYVIFLHLNYFSYLDMLGLVTPVAGSIFRPLSLTQKSGSEFSDGHIPRFCSVFEVIQVISSAKFFLAEEVDLSFNSVTKAPRTLPASLDLHLVDVW